MAVKYFCDGCDRQIPVAQIRNISVQVREGDAATAATGQYELCKSCSDTLIKEANPKNWVRIAPEKAA